MNFIGQWIFEDTKVCDDLIYFFNHSSFAKERKSSGTVGQAELQLDVKKSTDLSIIPEYFDIPEVNNYLKQLEIVCEKYKEKYEWCNRFSPWCIDEGFNVQHYKPTEGFYGWHTERENCTHRSASRHLVFMTYLNDVTDGGETEWYYQKLKIKPQKGLSVIWPADWTHVHKGVASPTQEKYIATGWYNYIE